MLFIRERDGWEPLISIKKQMIILPIHINFNNWLVINLQLLSKTVYIISYTELVNLSKTVNLLFIKKNFYVFNNI
jgi:hypothetical protein